MEQLKSYVLDLRMSDYQIELYFWEVITGDILYLEPALALIKKHRSSVYKKIAEDILGQHQIKLHK